MSRPSAERSGDSAWGAEKNVSVYSRERKQSPVPTKSKRETRSRHVSRRSSRVPRAVLRVPGTPRDSGQGHARSPVLRSALRSPTPHSRIRPDDPIRRRVFDTLQSLVMRRDHRTSHNICSPYTLRNFRSSCANICRHFRSSYIYSLFPMRYVVEVECLRSWPAQPQLASHRLHLTFTRTSSHLHIRHLRARIYRL